MDNATSAAQQEQREASRAALARAKAELLGLRTHLTTIDDTYRTGPPPPPVADMASAAVAALVDAKRQPAPEPPTGEELRHEAHRAEIAALKRRVAQAAAPGVSANTAAFIENANGASHVPHFSLCLFSLIFRTFPLTALIVSHFLSLSPSFSLSFPSYCSHVQLRSSRRTRRSRGWWRRSPPCVSRSRQRSRS